MSTFRKTLAHYLPAVGIFVAFIALWQLAVTVFDIREYLLPGPWAVLQAMGSDEIPWLSHAWITAVEIVGAFVLAGAAGVFLGMVIAWSPGLSRALTPFLVFVNTLPKVAIAPLFLMWLGYGILPNMLIGALIGFFPVVINTAVGLTQIDQDLVDLGRVFSAPKWKVFVKIRIPNAYPYILSALKVTATSAVVGAIVGEFAGASAGLGYVIQFASTQMQMPLVFAALVEVSLLGVLFYYAVEGFEYRFITWGGESRH